MPQAATIQPTSGGPFLQVDPTHQAGRISIRPMEYGPRGGAYSIGSLSGIMAAGLAAASPVVCFRWAPTDNKTLALVRRVRFTAGNLGTAFTAGGIQINMFVARAFTVIDTGGAALTTSGNNAKRRSSFPPSQLTAGQIVVSATAALTAGTRTKDANPCGAIGTSIAATAGNIVVPMPGLLFDNGEAGKYPLVLAPQEGFCIEATVPATGTWTFAWDMDWDEVESY